VLFKKVSMLLAALTAVLTIAACSEKLEGGASCPLLCPEQAVDLRDTTIEAVVFDTTVAGLPPIGSENFLMLASHGDTLETRAIVRFDTIPQSFTAGNNVDSTITHLDSAVLVVPIVKPDSAHRPKNPITIEAYNVDSLSTDSTSVATDTVSSVLSTFFRPNRLIGSKTFRPESLLDTLQIPISTDTVLDRVQTGRRLRVGFRLVSNPGYDLRIGSQEGLNPVSLRLRASRDTAAKPITLTPSSRTPLNQDFLSVPLGDYAVVVRGINTLTPATILAVGGVPSRRSLLRFDVPSRIVDSTTIVRASLILTQTPNRRLNPRDSFYVFPAAVLAQSTITDVKTLLQFVGGIGGFGLDSLRLAPGDSGQKSFQIVALVRTWKGNAATVSPRSIALRSSEEGQAPGEIDFFSSRAAAALRPKLRLTYVPQTSFGLP
jgi:hypothetical protein